MMIVILEGIDGTGKTTRALELVDMLREKGKKAEYVKFPNDPQLQKFIRNPDNLSEIELQELMLGDFMMTGLHLRDKDYDVIVVDRFTPISSMVYFGEMSLTYDALNIFDKLLSSPRYIIYNVINEPFRSPDKEDHFERKNMNELRKKYVNFDFFKLFPDKIRVLVSSVDLRIVSPKQMVEDIIYLQDSMKKVKIDG